MTPQKTKIKKYLSTLEIKSIDNNVSMVNVEKIFLFAVDDFRKGKNSVEDLSGICSYLWSFIQGNKEANENPKLEHVLLRGAEMEYYLYEIERSEEAGLIFVSTLKDILHYKK